MTQRTSCSDAIPSSVYRLIKEPPNAVQSTVIPRHCAPFQSGHSTYPPEQPPPGRAQQAGCPRAAGARQTRSRRPARGVPWSYRLVSRSAESYRGARRIDTAANKDGDVSAPTVAGVVRQGSARPAPILRDASGLGPGQLGAPGLSLILVSVPRRVAIN